MEVELEVKIEQLLLQAAKRKKLIPYRTFHALFPSATALAKRYVILEKVASSLCNLGDADYASLLSTDSGLPGPDFYARFRRLHADRYYATLGVDRNRHLRLAEKRQFAREAREQVYRHYRASAESVPTEYRTPADGAASIDVLHGHRNSVLGVVLVASGLFLATASVKAQEFSLAVTALPISCKQLEHSLMTGSSMLWTPARITPSSKAANRLDPALESSLAWSPSQTRIDLSGIGTNTPNEI